MAFDRAVFWDALTDSENLDPLHVEIANYLFDEWESRPDEDPRGLAYVMATALDDHHRVEEPDIETGCKNLLIGMVEGIYTGYGLKQFFGDGWSAWVPARAIVDKEFGDSESVANDAKVIYSALLASSNISMPDPGTELTELPGIDTTPPDPGDIIDATRTDRGSD